MARRKRMRRTGKSKIGYWKIRKEPFPSKDIIRRLELKPLNISKYREKKD
jgi:hypothetical protein